MNYVWTWSLAGMLLLSPVLEAQDVNLPSLIEENMEELSMQDVEEYNWEEELEELSRRIREPLNINTVTKQQLEQFPFLTDTQIENLLAYLYIHGQMQTVYELQLVSGIDKRTIDLLLPFVYVRAVDAEEKYPSPGNILKYGKHELLTRLDIPFYTRKGYEKNYLGPPLYHSFRYDFHYGEYLQLGMTGEKDAGEPLFALHDRKGYDYYSFYFLVRNLGKLRTLALGNYRMSFGQGLVLSTDFNFGKTFSVSAGEYRSSGIRKHASTDEYSYFRGGAACLEVLPSLQLTAFYSHRSMDGVMEDGEITSIYKTGLHRTLKEAGKRDAFELQLTGGNIRYEKKGFKIGLTGIYYFFNHPYQPKLEKYAKYNLNGREFYNFSTDYRIRLGKLVWTGEAASGKRGYALLNKLNYRLSASYGLLLIHRLYSHDYWAFFARSFGEGGSVQNENGWYLAAEASPFAHLRFFVSADLFSFPWWRYRISKPSQGVDGMFQLTYSPNKDCSMYLSYRCKRKERDVTGTSGSITLPTFHHRLRYRFSSSLGQWKLKTTFDCNYFRQVDGKGYRFDGKKGLACTQFLEYSPLHLPVSFSLQGSYFDTDDYDSRVYVSERGLLYTFYTPSFSGKGFRCSSCIRCDLGKHFMLLAKLGHTVYLDRDEISSGNDLIKGNKKSDLQLQARIKF